MPLAVRGDDQGKLRLLEPRVCGQAADAQQMFSVEQQESHLAVVVDLGEPCRHLVAHLAYRPEEAQPDVLRRQMTRELLQQPLVFWPDRTDAQLLVAMLDRGLEFNRIGPDGEP